MRKIFLLSTFLLFFAATSHGQTVQCQTPSGAWGPCPLNASVQLFNAVAATGTATATAQKVYNFSMTGNLLVTWASITGSPSGCTLQVKSGDSLGNLINNGAAISVTPANGTSSTVFNPATTQQTADQITAVYSCATYPGAGTLSLEFVPATTSMSLDASGNLKVTATLTNNSSAPSTNNLGVLPCLAGTSAPSNTNGDQVLLSCDTSGNIRVVIPGALPAGTNTIGKVDILGNAGASVDAATNAAPPANGIQPIVVSATALPAAVTVTDTVAPMADKFGRQVMIPFAMRDLITMASVQTTNATQTTLLAAQTSQFADLVSLTITNESATACTVSLTDNTKTYKFNVANQQGAGFTINPPTPIPATSTATAWQVTGCASVTLDYVAEFVLNK